MTWDDWEMPWDNCRASGAFGLEHARPVSHTAIKTSNGTGPLTGALSALRSRELDRLEREMGTRKEIPMKTHRPLLPVLTVLGLAACQSSTDSTANLSQLDRQAILAAVDATPYAGPDFGEPSPTSNFQGTGSGAQAFAARPVTLPPIWVVRHGEPTNTKTVTMSNDTATVNLTISYNGT